MDQSDSLTHFLTDVKSKNKDVQAKAARDLRQHVENEARDIPPDQFNKYMNDLNKRIFDLINSPEPTEKMGGCVVIDELIDVAYDDEENEKRIIRFAHYLRMVFQHSGDQTEIALLRMCAKALGHLARAGETIAADIVEFEVKRALEWLDGDRRLAAVLVLQELAENTPALFHVYVDPFLEHIWVAVRDPKATTREAAVDAMRACLEVIANRAPASRQKRYLKVFGEVQTTFKQNNADAIHGALLVIGELLANTDEFMLSRFKEVCETVVTYKDDRDKLVRETVIGLLPKLAKFEPEAFGRGYLVSSLNHILATLRSGSISRAIVFVALGKMAVAVGAQIGPELPQIVPLLKETLIPKKGKPPPPDISKAAIESVSMLVKAVGGKLLDSGAIGELITGMFMCGLSKALVGAMTELSTNIPSLLPDIQKKLLGTIRSVLAFTVPAHVEDARRMTAVSAFSRLTRPSLAQAPAAHVQQSSIPLTRLALKTLGTFNFESHEIELNEIVMDMALGYLDNQDVTLRQQAASTCLAVLLRGPAQAQETLLLEQDAEMSDQESSMVFVILHRLLTVGVVDPAPEIRLAVLQLLHERFDPFLIHAGCMRALCVTLNDEVIEVREAGVRVIGRLAVRDPACAMPHVRRILVQLLTELEFGRDNKNREDAASLLSILIERCQELVREYVDSILKVLLPKLQETDSKVSSCVLATIGKVAYIAGEKMNVHLPILLPIIIKTLQDKSSSSSKRQVALKTLSELINSTGSVIAPYVRFPDLLPAILVSLKGTQWTMRREVIRVLGILGALDPYQHKMIVQSEEERKKAQERKQDDHPSSMVAQKGEEDSEKVEDDDNLKLSHSNMEFFPGVAINALVKILRDKGLSQHHNKVIQALMFIFKNLGMRCTQFLPQIIPHFLEIMHFANEESAVENRFTQLGILVTIVKGHIAEYLGDIFNLIKEYLKIYQNFTGQLQDLIQFISIALRDQFQIYLPDILPELLSILHSDRSPNRAPTLRVLALLSNLAGVSQDYLHLIIPVLAKLCELLDAPFALTEQTILTIETLARGTNIASHAARVVHVFGRLLATPERPQTTPTNRTQNAATTKAGASNPTQNPIKQTVMETLCVLVYQLKLEYVVFIPIIAQAMTQGNVPPHAHYTALMTKLVKGIDFEMSDLPAPRPPEANMSMVFDTQQEDTSNKKIRVSQSNLQKAWDAQHKATKEDWQEWIRGFSIELLKESTSPALRVCQILAQKYHPLAGELFNAAFVSCWSELHDKVQDDLVRNLRLAYGSDTLPPEVLQKLLNLAEFMEHDDKRLPIDGKVLGNLAEKVNAYAKALRYKEDEFHNAPGATIESLISVNIQLGQPDAARGVLQYGKDQYNLKLKESWYEKLQRWEDALEAYERAQVEEPTNLETSIGRMRCQRALGQDNCLLKLVASVWHKTEPQSEERNEIATLAVQAAWELGEWDIMRTYMDSLDGDNVKWQQAFFQAVMNVKETKFDEATKQIEIARRLLDTKLAALVGESYDRAYKAIVNTQQLVELEEVIDFKTNKDSRERIQTMWTRRLRGCQMDVDVWRHVLLVRSLVVTPKDDITTWLKFSAMCRKDGRLSLSNKVLTDLLGFDPQASTRLISNKFNPVVHDKDLPLPTVIAQVSFAYVCQLWAVSDQDKALHMLQLLVKEMETSYAKDGQFVADKHPLAQSYANVKRPNAKQVQQLWAKMYLKLGTWQETVEDDLNTQNIPQILNSFKQAVNYDAANYKVWHNWAVTNYRVAQIYKQTAHDNPESGGNSSSLDVSAHIIPAINGFFKSIALAGDQSIQDLLRLLTMLFSYGYVAQVETAFRQGLLTMSIDTWLSVIPQLIARIDHVHGSLRKMIIDILTTIGKAHPQALVYPLTVASETNRDRGTKKANTADEVLRRMKEHSPALVEQAGVVSHELLRVAILPPEMWHEALEEASRLYFGQRDVEAMFLTLAPLHKILDEGPQTTADVAFMHNYGRDLKEAHEWCQRYSRTKNESDLNQAWDLYFFIFRQVDKQLKGMTEIELQYVAPRLLEARDLELAVPGTYLDEKSAPNNPPVQIATFAPKLQVISSKQRPRKLQMIGSDGHEYVFLLKGHEDLRQDERVMQLFFLVNQLLSNNRATAKNDLKITRYSVIPLAPNSGLIQWLSSGETLHSVVSWYRERRNIELNLENMLLSQASSNDYQALTPIQKLYVFESVHAQTTGQDLAKVLWLRSKNSEIWLDRRTNYVRSLAVMSMVGYILGLGDRHPRNLMLDRYSGKIIHIDFGDCFEVAMLREKCPEKVPFRLTRMLIAPMGVSGTEGNFRTTCESVMSVLRSNRESVMAVLEAFVYDPLINWRLLRNNPSDDMADPSAAAVVSAGGIADITEDFILAARRGPKHKNSEDVDETSVAGEEAENTNILNEKAVEVIDRVQSKLNGKDFDPDKVLHVTAQVEQLFEQATSHLNLCQGWMGWFPLW